MSIPLVPPSAASLAPSSARWGELPAFEDDPGIAALERETVTKVRPMTVEPIKLFQPTSSEGLGSSVKQERKVSGLFGPPKTEDESAQASAIETSPSLAPSRFSVHADPRIIHTLQLSQYAKKMNALIVEAHTQDDKSTTETVGGKKKLPPMSSSTPTVPKSPPPLPPLPAALEAKKIKSEKSFPFDSPPAEEDISAFASGRWSHSPSSSSSSSTASPPIAYPPSIAPQTCRQLLKKSVITLIAHSGYDNAAESAVELLADLLHSYLSQLTTNLSDIRDSEMTSGSLEFPDILERVFTEMGIGSAKTVVRFHEKNVVARHNALRQQCSSLETQYRELTTGGPAVQASISSETTISAEGLSQDHSDDSNAWFLIDEGGGSSAKGLGNEERFDASALVRDRSEGIASNKQSAASAMSTAAFAIAPGLVHTADSTDYDADDDVITEPSSVKSGFENENNGVVVEDGSGDGGVVGGSGGIEDSGFDLVASTLIRIESPSSSKGAKKKKKK